MIRLTAERTPAGTSYLATGQGQPVVLIHGVGLNKEMWGGQVVGLAKNYRVITYDMLGHGASPRPASGTPLLGYAEQLLELLDHLQLPAATVIGFSMGGLVARDQGHAVADFARHALADLGIGVGVGADQFEVVGDGEGLGAHTAEVAGGFRHGPIASVIWQQVKIDGYTESANAGTLATALGYGKQDVDSTVGRIGWQARFDGGAVKPYVQVTYDHEFEDTKQASAWVQSLPDVGMYRVPGMDFDKNYATAILGARMELFGLQSNIGLSATTLQKRAQDATLFASFSGSFTWNSEPTPSSLVTPTSPPSTGTGASAMAASIRYMGIGGA